MNDWRYRAACKDDDPELFFPVGTSGPALLQTAEAKSVCYRCEVTWFCLTWALESGQDAGVWGGMTEGERRALKRKGKRRPTVVPPPPPPPPPPAPKETAAELERRERQRRARRAAYARMYRARRMATMTPEQLAAHKAKRAKADRIRYEAAKAASSSAPVGAGASS
jgi:WhiB family redox-sensing transcriptional regulator